MRSASHRPRNRLREQFTWTLPANAIYGICNLLLLVVLNKRGSAAIAGEFSLALAITAPIFMFANLRFGTILASDMRARVPIADYFRLRLQLLALALVATAGVLLLNPTTPFRWLLVVTACVKVVEGLSELCCGMHQRIERMDRIGMSLVTQGLAMTAVFATAFHACEQLYLAMYGLLVARLLVLAIHEIPMARRTLQHAVFSATEAASRQLRTGTILLTAAPLGMTAAFVSLASNIPRYVIADHFTEETLGHFCSLAVALQAGNLVFRAIEQPAVPRLARLLRDHDAAGFWRLLGSLSGLFLVVGSVGALVSLALGPLVLTWIYTPVYGPLAGVLAAMVFATAVAQVAGMVESSLIAARRTAVQVPMHLVTVLSCLGLSLWCIPLWGLYGAVLAVTICRLPFLGIGVWLLRRKLAEGPAPVSYRGPQRRAA